MGIIQSQGEEREALLSFKRGILYPSNRLSSWRGEECCAWEGVACHNITGHVLKLDLQGSCWEGHINNSSVELKHLQYLDLSQNYFGSIRIPKFIGSFADLRYLNHSQAGFVGPIPHQLGNLSRLRYLDIRRGVDALSFIELEWISGLPSLKFLDLSGVDLSKASKWLQAMNYKLRLSVLHLSFCQLDSTPGSLPNSSFSSLFVLDLSCNNIISSRFDRLSDMFSLVVLDLSHNEFHGQIPRGIGNMTSLKFIDLSYNSFVSSIPPWLYHIPAIERLDLSSNRFLMEGIHKYLEHKS